MRHTHSLVVCIFHGTDAEATILVTEHYKYPKVGNKLPAVASRWCFPKKVVLSWAKMALYGHEGGL